MAQSRKGSKKNSKINLLLLGDVGSRKSEKSLEMLLLKRPSDGKPFRVLYIDIENGSIDDRLGRFQDEYGVNLENLLIIYTQSVTEVLEYIETARSNDDFYELDEEGNTTDKLVLDADGLPFRPDAIVVDGMALLTASKKMSLLETSKLRAKLRVSEKKLVGTKALVTVADSKMEFIDYEQVNNEGVRLVLSLVGSGKHFVVTSFAKDEREEVSTGELDSFGNVKKVKTGKLIPNAFKGLIEYCKTVICLEQDDYTGYKAYVQDKDRTETFTPNEVIPDFSMTMFQGVVDKGSDFVVKCNYEQNIQKDAEKFISEQNPFDVPDVSKMGKPQITKPTVVVETTQETTSDNDNMQKVLELRKKCSNIINASGKKADKLEIIKKLKSNGCSLAVTEVNDVGTLEKYLEVLLA